MEVEDRRITLEAGNCQLPERLLLAHARGEVLFITGAGTSRPSKLPDFRELVLAVYEVLDMAAHAVLKTCPTDGSTWTWPSHSLSPQQRAEAQRFSSGEYDVVLGMLERRIDANTGTGSTSKVRDTVCDLVRTVPDASGKRTKPTSSDIHRSLIRLADRGGTATIVTTNFDLLLETAQPRGKRRLRSLSLGAMPRPSYRSDFSGVLHIHGQLGASASIPSEVIVTDHDFGEHYLRRRTIPDFIYDAARLFHLVLVGYSANDAPMRYLLNAVAADGTRFSDLRERFAFVGLQEPFDPVAIEDWKGRGITPIPYSDKDGHAQLGSTLRRWAVLSAVNGREQDLDRELRRIIALPHPAASDADRDLFEHLIRRGSATERARIARYISARGADISWLSAALTISRQAGKSAR